MGGRSRDWHFIAFLLLCVLLIPVTRLPQFLGGHMVPDGDEGVLGIMSKHILEGKAFPVFYYGQSYGLSTLEAGTAALFFKLFGMSTESLKASMLLLWTVGWLFLVLAIRRWFDRRTACIAAILMATCPAWGMASMKAWGGNITAFLLTNFCFWILSREEGVGRAPWRMAIVTGGCVGLVYLAKPIWLPGMVPVAGVVLIRRRQWPGVVVIVVAAIGLAALLSAVAPRVVATDYWSPPLFRNPDVFLAIRRLPYRIWVSMTGSHWMEYRYVAGPLTDMVAAIWSVAVPACLFVEIRAWTAGRRWSIRQAAMAGVLGVVGFTLPLNHILFGFRYLLPLIGFLIIPFSAELGDLIARQGTRRLVAYGLIIVLVLMGSGSLVEHGAVAFTGSFVHGWVPEKAAVQAVAQYLSDNNIRYVYSVDPMFHWTLMFVSGEKVAARWIHPYDRYPAYPRSVDEALMKGGNVAIVGRVRPGSRYSRDLKTFQEDLRKVGYGHLKPQVIGDMFYVLPHPSVTLIRSLGFRLNT